MSSGSGGHVTIVGGGITGLAAAWELERRGHLDYTLVEAEPRWGGKITTRTVTLADDGRCVVEGGPESFVTRKPQVWTLVHELGLQSALRTPTSETSHMFVLHDGRPMPAPVSPAAFVTSSLLTPRGKLRMLAEPFRRARQDPADESIADFVDRRLGRQARERFLGPVLGGIYSCDPTRASILVAAPLMREMEHTSGSLVKGALVRARASARERRVGQAPTRPRFVTLEGGAGRLVEAIVAQLRGDLALGVAVTALAAAEGGWRVTLSDGRTRHSRAVLFAAPAPVAAGLLEGLAPESAKGLRQLRHTSIGTATLLYAAPAPALRRQIHGLMIPRDSGRLIDAISVISLKAPERFPAGALAIRVFFGGAAPDLVEAPDETLAAALCEEVGDLLGITRRPDEIVTFRWPGGFPQADVGHLDTVAAIEAALPLGLALAGSSYRGTGVPDCIRQGREAAAALLEHPVTSQSPTTTQESA
ncbi:MAG: protoporphyrinogen oxidase [Actinomycetales bacterium]|nr:protoporphyrinogen oxidase [Actinomycetales bacterium]